MQILIINAYTAIPKLNHLITQNQKQKVGKLLRVTFCHRVYHAIATRVAKKYLIGIGREIHGLLKGNRRSLLGSLAKPVY